MPAALPPGNNPVSNVNKKVQLDATICRHLFTAKSLTSDFAVNKCLHIVASSWTFLLTLNHDARNHELKKNSVSICTGSLVVLRASMDGRRKSHPHWYSDPWLLQPVARDGYN